MASKIMNWNIWDTTILGVDFYHIVSWLIIFSFLGWFWESCFVSIKNHKWVNRGFVAGPFCTIYGVGAVSVYLILQPFAYNYFLIYLSGMVVATVLEYITSCVMEKIFHAKWWDYSMKKFNFQGKICLGSSIGWGFMSLLLFLLMMPFANWIMSLYSHLVGQIAVILIGAYYIIDFVFASAAAFDLSEKLVQLEASFGELSERLKESRFYEEFANAKDELEKQAEVLRKFNFRDNLEGFKNSFQEKQSRAARRLLRAYPSLPKNVPKPKELQEVLDKILEVIKKNR